MAINKEYRKNFQRFITIISAEDLLEIKCVKLLSGGFMPLSLEVLYSHKRGYVISMTHYFEMNGDLVCDPDLELLMDVSNKELIPRAIQHSTGHYQRAYFENEDGTVLVKRKAVRELNEFLGQWLTNLIHQGFSYRDTLQPNDSPKEIV
jgi:uncharacterized protein YqiB (DUF1249 family)